MKLASEFRTFVLRGNVVDLAVGIVIGVSFGAVVGAFNAAFLTPLVGLIQLDLDGGSFTLGGETFAYGLFLQATVTFLLTALVVFFFVVKPVNALRMQFEGPVVEEAPSTRDCPECLSAIPLGAKRCSHCTTILTSVA